MSVPNLLVKRLSPDAILPKRGSHGAAGYDLYAAVPTTIPSRGLGIIKTDIAVKIPEGHYGRVAPRSGMTVKKGTDVGAGVIDEDYRGNIGVVLFNHTDENLEIAHGDRVAQLIIEKIATPEVVEVPDLDQTGRGTAGFGSTGR